MYMSFGGKSFHHQARAQRNIVAELAKPACHPNYS
jgi:hypothetical protein